jgi:hypothetical protein
MSDTVAETLDAAIAVERTSQRADSWTEGRPIRLHRELRSLCWAIAWQALTGGDLDQRPDLLDALELDVAALGRIEGRGLISLSRRRREAAGRLDSAIAAAAAGEDERAAIRARLREEPLHVPLTRALLLLGRHAEYESLWHAELDEVLGGRPVTARDLDALPYTRSVLERSARFLPAAAIAEASPILVTLGQRWAFRTVPGHDLRLRPVRRS